MAEVSGIDDYSLVFIKPQLLDEGVHFYIDPEQDNAIYTYQKINPEAIVKCIDDYKRIPHMPNNEDGYKQT